jgi:NAD(P)-dependent dehydrogenase (short-subunit alcohol dehydrogenase family)
VTGGASGLGGATARMLAAAGGNVLVLDVNTDACEAMTKELGARAHFVRTDVTSEANVQKAVAATSPSPAPSSASPAPRHRADENVSILYPERT